MPETIAVRPDEQLDLELLKRVLVEAGVSGFDPALLEVEQFPSGQSNLTYLLRAGACEAVLRRPPLGPVAPRAHDMGREYNLLRRLHPAFPLAPRPYLLHPEPCFYVMERRRGLVLDQRFPPGWQPGEVLHRHVTESFVQVLVDLHQVDWRAAGLGDIGRPEGYMQRQVTGWLGRYEGAKTPEAVEVGALGSWLNERVPNAADATVIHNDYKLNNVLLDPAEPSRITAVLDWEMATVGDPLSDLATTLAYWTEPGEELLGGLRSVSGEPGFPSRADVAEMYARMSGRDLAEMDFYLAFAYFKVAVIAQQIFYRWHVGQTRDERFGGLGEVAKALVRQAQAEARL